MLFKTPFLDPFGIYLFHILYSRQLKRLKDVQRPLFFSWKHLWQCWKALSLDWIFPAYFCIQYSCCMTWVHEGTSKSRKCTSRAKSCPSPRHGKGSEKNKNGPFWPWNFLEIQQNRQTDGKFMKFLDVSCFFFFSQTRGLSASLLFAALGPMSKEQLEVLWPCRAVMSPIFFWRTAKLQSENQKSMNIPEGSRR